MPKASIQQIVSDLRSDGDVKRNASARAKAILDGAGLAPTETVDSAVAKLMAAADRVAPGGVLDVTVEPLAFTLLERPLSVAADVTATGTVKCTFDAWDGCSSDVDW